MNFKDQLAQDAADVFTNAEEFAETWSYRADDGSITDVDIVVDRSQARRNPAPGRGAVPGIQVTMRRAAIRGRLLVSAGRDKLIGAPELNGAVHQLLVANIIHEDAGVFVLELR